MGLRKTLSALVLLTGFVALTHALLSHGETKVFVESSSTRAPVPPDETKAGETELLLALLLEREVPVESPIAVTVTREDLEASGTPGERKFAVGITKEVGIPVGLSEVRPRDLDLTPLTLSHGSIRGNGKGGFTWSSVVKSPGAVALRLRFANFFLPKNAELYLYSDHGDVAGPYTRRGPGDSGEFWSQTLRGSEVTLQLAYEGTDTARALAAARFLLADLAHLDDRFALALFGATGDEQAGEGLCSNNAPCIENASCSTLDPAIDPARGAVAMILFESGNGPFRSYYVCSGGLLNDTDDGSTRPFFLTANHCISKNSEAASAETFFNYTVPCNQSCGGIPGLSSTVGASIVGTGKTGDYTLLELSEAPPAGAVFLGWTSAPVATTNGTPLFRISHPAAAPQAYSEQEVDTARSTCRSWPRGGWIYSSDTFGGTEGGSSGSPVLNDAGQVVGQLSGACGYNVNDACDSVQNAIVDGAFAAYYSNIASILDPNTSCTDGDNDSYCSEGADCDDTDASINPGAVEVCDDSLDNDCNGAVDLSDEACQAPGCDVLLAGKSCISNSECCSAKCKGKPGSKTCR